MIKFQPLFNENNKNMKVEWLTKGMALLIFSFVLNGCSVKPAINQKYQGMYKSYLGAGEVELFGTFQYMVSTDTNGIFIYRRFFPDPIQIIEETRYKDDKLFKMDGLSTNWYDNGHKWSEGLYLNESRIGKWSFYHWQGGNLEATGEFLNEKKIGLWEIYDEQERLMKIEKHDTILNNWTVESYDTLGNFKEEYSYKNGELVIIDDTIIQTHNSHNYLFEEHMPFLSSCKHLLGIERDNCSKQTLFKFLMDNLKYPKEAIQNNVEGTTYTEFVVDISGNITNVNVISGVSKEIKAETLRLFSLIPKWEPAIQHNRKVAVQYSLPIKFKLTN
ncbi:MAG TPA: energy transducer TonB [Saprospiraceae bacterium]|nr:energy transducer TonB [Saprospiraceae bacterium]